MSRLLSAVIFDFDGIVLDSETPEYEAHRLIFERCGATLTRDEWCDQIGVWTEGHLGRWLQRLRTLSPDAPDEAAFVAEKRRLFSSLLPSSPMPGITGLLDLLAAAGVPLAIASSSPAEWVVPALRRLRLDARFGTVVTGDQVERRKPAPDVYAEAGRRLGVDVAQAVAIEDSAPGIAAARAAGMTAVAIPHWLTECHDLSGANLRIAHAGELSIDCLEALVEGHRPDRTGPGRQAQ